MRRHLGSFISIYLLQALNTIFFTFDVRGVLEEDSNRIPVETMRPYPKAGPTQYSRPSNVENEALPY
jgi:hypothetical protein